MDDIAHRIDDPDAPPQRLPTVAELEIATTVFRLLADGTRVQLLLLLREGERSVGELADATGASPTSVSQHLAKMRLSGVVVSRKDGAFVRYSLTDDHLLALVDEAISHAVHQTQ